MSNCSKHKKEIAGISDMKLLAEMIGDLHYETLSDLMKHLSSKIFVDGQKDFQGGRTQLGSELFKASEMLNETQLHIQKAWEISKPFMK